MHPRTLSPCPKTPFFRLLPALAKACLLLGALLGLPAAGYAQPLTGFDPGIQNSAVYQEYVFLSGQPVLVSGSLKSSVKEKNNQRVEKYTYTLSNPALQATVNRSLTLTSTLTREDRQTLESAVVSGYKETVKIGAKTWTADPAGSSFTQSAVYDTRPAVQYYSASLSYKKRFLSGQDAPRIVEMEGTATGYDQAWGSTDIRELQYFLSQEAPLPGAPALPAGTPALPLEGAYEAKLSNHVTKDLAYVSNKPQDISFRGGHMLSQKDESQMNYRFDLGGRAGQGALTLGNNPVLKRLSLPAFRDISGHWAQEPIEVLGALRALDASRRDFGPSLPITREEFAKAVAVVSDIVEQGPAPRRSRRAAEPPIFSDTAIDSEKYRYVQSVAGKGLMAGVGGGLFDPKGPLTKAQAAQILVSALGLESLAPAGAYHTGYVDDARVPAWAKDCVYVAKQLQLISGTPKGYFQPDKQVSRAEAAALLYQYIHYLSQALREDYLEGILNH